MQVYRVQESAFQGAHQRALSQVYKDAHQHRFDVLLIWALDRLSREGVAATLEIVARLGKSGVKVWSYQEPWTDTDGESLELLLSIAAWVARMESVRRAERTKAGLGRAVKQGKKLGRPPGSKDKRKRKTRGYLLRYSE